MRDYTTKPQRGPDTQEGYHHRASSENDARSEDPRTLPGNLRFLFACDRQRLSKVFSIMLSIATHCTVAWLDTYVSVLKALVSCVVPSAVGLRCSGNLVSHQRANETEVTGQVG